MKKERFYYGADLNMVTIAGLTTNDGTLVGVGGVEKKLGKLDRVTICGILDTENNTMSFGVCRCSSKDNFVKSFGQRLARKRALISPYRVVKIDKNAKISDVFSENATEIEDEVLRMVYPIKLF